jgi:hypothetical protein
MTYGFTGTSGGMTFLQKGKVRDLFVLLNIKELHHGDCVGADEEAHSLARLLLNIPHIVIHPPVVQDKRAFCRGNEIRLCKPYLSRNKDIVREGRDGLIAAPSGFTEVLRSGTWATIRAARKMNRHIWIVFPDGTVREE